MSELKKVSEKLEMLWQANSFTDQITKIKTSNPEWYECGLEKGLVFSLIGHQEFFSSELIKLKRIVDELEKGE
jgi:hypothetical protein